MSGIIIARNEDGREIRFQSSWHARDATTAAPGISSWQSLDITILKDAESPEFSWPENIENTKLFIELSANVRQEIDAQYLGSPSAFSFVIDCLSGADRENMSWARLVLPQSGYIIRSDIIPLRLLDCPLAASVKSFAKPHQFFEGKPVGSVTNLEQLPNVFAASAGGLLLKIDNSTGNIIPDSQINLLDTELNNRLSFPWISIQPPERKTLVIVDGGITSPDRGGTGVSIYAAAEALGIDMVAIDSPGHWLDGPRYSHWIKEFIPLELPILPDADFTNKIVDAVRSYKGQVDGIVSFRDHYKFPVAEAALKLSLPTYPPSAYAIATDKFQTSQSEGRPVYQASGVEQAVDVVQKNDLNFPLIIKPCNGFLSEGVFRVNDLAQLEAGVRAIDPGRHGKEFLIEKYCDGPEVDANFVLCDGEVLFFEASDDFPKGADSNSHGDIKTFIELECVFPSKLPEKELNLLRDSLHQSLLRMGFQNGFYHLEARVDNSTMEYATKNNVFDLAEREIPAQSAPSAWLIEVNPRPPGIQESEVIKYTYGIDYWALGLLFALDDKDRAKQLSHPFAQGAQYWSEIVFVPVTKGGIFESDDVCAELFGRRPDLASHVSKSFCFLSRGDRVHDPIETGVNSWVAYFNVYSRESREHVLEIANSVLQEVRITIS